MSDQPFVDFLQRLAESDRGALAKLRRSLSFEPGTVPCAFPYVERFIGHEEGFNSARRLAYYLVAGLFALHPQPQGFTVAKAMGVLYRRKEQSPSIEGRFIALLESDDKTVVERLRHCVTLLRAHDLAIDYRILLFDLIIWLNPARSDELDKLRCRWAGDFYRVAVTKDSND